MDAVKVERVVKRTKQKTDESFFQDKIRSVTNGAGHSFMVTEGDKTWRITIKSLDD